MNIPDIVKKDKEIILKEIASKVPYYTPEWEYGIKGELGTALCKIFAHFFETITNRINLAPYKHSIAFFEKLGVSLLPPTPSRTALTFLLSQGTTDNIFIPAGTQASSQDKDGKSIYFETEKSIIAVASKLLNVFSFNGISDEIFSHTEAINGGKSSKLFNGLNLQKHILYIGDSNIFNIKKAIVIINIKGIHTKVLSLLSDNNVSWQYSIERVEKKFGKEEKNIFWMDFDKTEIDKSSGNVLLYKISNEKIPESCIFKIKTRWIRCINKNLNISLFRKIKIEEIGIRSFNADEKSIDIKKIHGIGDEFYEKLAGEKVKNKIDTLIKLLRYSPVEISELLGCSIFKAENILEAAKKEFYYKKGEAEIIEEEGIIPDMAFCNDVPLNLSEKIYPFGAKPRLYSTFYIASEEVFSKRGYKVNILLKLNKGIPSSNINMPRLSWEYWDGETWKLIKDINENMASQSGATSGFTTNINIQPEIEKHTISLPQIQKVKVNGKENYWIRVRLVEGDYGCEFKLSNSNEIIQGEFNPPVIHFIKFEYYKDKEDSPDYLITENNCEYRIVKKSFTPFESLTDLYPSIYFCFDMKMEKGPIGIFIDIDEKFEYPENFQPNVRWSYYSVLQGWKELDIKDETEGFTKKGVLFFSIDEEMRPTSLLGENEKFWLKASITGDFYTSGMLPIIKGFYLNTTWALQVQTIKDEIIGFGSIVASQNLKTMNSPVIDISIMVNEFNTLSESEMNTLRKSGITIKEKKDTKGKTEEFCIEWKEVTDFINSGSKDRHYVIDKATGTLWFGNGINGMLPPSGKDNIKADYRIGGGKKGNLKSKEINKLQSSIASIDKVFNPIASECGIDKEDLDSLLIRAPNILKNRGRATTIDDFICIVKESSRDIARVKILPNISDKNKYETGWVTVIIVPFNSDSKPLPTPSLCKKVKEYLLDRCPNIASIRVMPPLYIKADTYVEIYTKTIEAVAEIENEARKSISNFLHPLTGGSDFSGWAFGQIPCLSDLYALLENIKNVDYIKTLSITLYSEEGIKIGDITDLSTNVKIPDYGLIYNGEQKLKVRGKIAD